MVNETSSRLKCWLFETHKKRKTPRWGGGKGAQSVREIFIPQHAHDSGSSDERVLGRRLPQRRRRRGWWGETQHCRLLRGCRVVCMVYLCTSNPPGLPLTPTHMAGARETDAPQVAEGRVRWGLRALPRPCQAGRPLRKAARGVSVRFGVC